MRISQPRNSWKSVPGIGNRTMAQGVQGKKAGQFDLVVQEQEGKWNEVRLERYRGHHLSYMSVKSAMGNKRF